MLKCERYPEVLPGAPSLITLLSFPRLGFSSYIPARVGTEALNRPICLRQANLFSAYFTFLTQYFSPSTPGVEMLPLLGAPAWPQGVDRARGHQQGRKDSSRMGKAFETHWKKKRESH